MKRWWPVVVIVLVLVGAGTAVYVDWTWKRKLSPRGGRPFLTRVELPVPLFQQGDDKWRDDPLGGVPENGTLGGEGCAVAAAAMVFKSYGIDVDPQQLNWFLTATDGFTEQGWLYWDRAAWFAPDRVRHVYEDLPSYQLIDSNIAHGNPVIVRVRLASGITHFVVIAGKDGFDYLVRDPGAGSAKGLYPLRELGSDIEALRFYQPIANTNSQRCSAALTRSITQRRRSVGFPVPSLGAKNAPDGSHPGRCCLFRSVTPTQSRGNTSNKIVFAVLLGEEQPRPVFLEYFRSNQSIDRAVSSDM